MKILVIFIILFIFILFEILTGFWLHTFILQLFQTIPIFILDLFKIDKKIYPGFGFKIYCGLGGSGKTISMVEEITRIKEKYPTVKVLTNFNCKLSDGMINSWRDLLETTNFQDFEITEKEYYKFKKYNIYKYPDLYIDISPDLELTYHCIKNCGVIFGFDEIHLTFESTNWEDAPANLLDYISQQRKLHKQILASSQVFTRIDKKLREQTNTVVDCKSILLGRLIIQKHYNTTEYIANNEKMDKGNQKRRVKKRYSFIAFDKIRNSYDTYQIMKNLTIEKSKEKRFLDLIKEFKSES